MTTENEPTCDKCGAPITTGLMAAFCPKRMDCEFWTEGIEQFMDGWVSADERQQEGGE
jgi:hypothetical protein